MTGTVTSQPASTRAHQFFQLTKPRVVSLIVFTAIIGMMLAVPGAVPLQPLVFGTVGIALVAGAAAAFNCLVERKIDAVMSRTRRRPLPQGAVSAPQTLVFAGLIGGVGLGMLYQLVNPLTMWLTLGTFVGYAVIYTVVLKPLTPQNIVIGGASGAMPPVLGWAAVTGEVSHDALLLFLIVFAWTPPHFWSLALYRRDDYAKAGVPMLPVTHGDRFTRLSVLLYTIILSAVTLLPFATRMSGYFYLVSALLLDVVYLAYAVKLLTGYSDALARRAFRYSIVYLSLLFAALLLDHYIRPLMRRTLALAAVLVPLLFGCAPDTFRATDITGADFARNLQLTGHDGQPRTLQDFAGKVVVVFFGFTHCPDICPTTLAKLASVAKALGPDAERLQVLFVTVDPERDTGEVLAQYVPSFDRRFIGLYGDADATARTAKEFKVLYQKQAGKTDQSYTVDHSAGTFAFDRAGRVRLFIRHDMTVEDLVHDLKILLDQ